ncbi:altered inheritance of mitochondria protein 21 [Dichotomopilus funicola]|uniref:Altered inheritance of mitochondria protein 21 n=1 Tax=Dichotomopilus funicola TaxID=1934379 RepID=A0AAN6UY14_9PEZI|nr:altered inheritance of mitochondria protein 21 [Dichotomopilus funicola]
MSDSAPNPPPTIPPRPSRAQEKTSVPMIPPRPTNRRLQRSMSPNHDRFAPSPLNEPTFPKAGSKPSHLGVYNGHGEDPIPRSTSVDLPSLGEEGQEYAALAEEINTAKEEEHASPEQTRTVGEDLKLHAPKPSLPASSAKQRVMAVTRTDSERAAAFGIGRASSVEDSIPPVPSNRSLKKKPSTASQLSATDKEFEDEHGIPEIGQRVPMYKNAGDVQAPSPAPPGSEGGKGKHHTRRRSGHANLPPGSYGLHGHNVVPQDKLEKAYYEKHPDLLKKEHLPHHYDRPNDFSMSRDDLNKIVRDTASRGSGLATAGTPSDQVGWQALEESASRIASPKLESPERKPPPIHVDEPNRRRSVMFSDTESVNGDDEPERSYTAPILADDEVAKDPSSYTRQPAVEPHEEPTSRPTSRPPSRPASLHRGSSFEIRHTPLEDVEEYEPLFNDDDKDDKPETEKPAAKEKLKVNQPRRFPSADIWEDAPSSVHYTAEVSTPELFDEQEKPSRSSAPTPKEGETPAQAFARQQEELAEKEAHGQRNHQQKPATQPVQPAQPTQTPAWPQQQSHLAAAAPALRPALKHRFPSRDVWEDAPESLQLETTVSTPQQDEAPPSPSPVEAKKTEVSEPAEPTAAKAPEPTAPSEKPAIPTRPKPRQLSDDKPAVPERPKSKPQIPARPVKAGATSGGLEPAEAAAPPRPKPAVPARPMGNKIAALQAGFMSDLNKRLQLGPQAPKKEESPPADEGEKAEVKEKVPLSDARKGRARGPQRRAPAPKVTPAPVAVSEAKAAATFSFVAAQTFFEIDPVEGALTAGVSVRGLSETEPKSLPTVEVAAAKAEPESQVAEQVDSGIASSVPSASDKGEEEDKTLATAASAASEEAPEKSATTVKEQEANSPEDVSTISPKPAIEPVTETIAEPEETKALATNMAGETLVAEKTEKTTREDGNGVGEEGEGGSVKVVEN